MSKFSSYPEQQLIFENWRSHNDNIEPLLDGVTPEQDKLIRESIYDYLPGFGSVKDNDAFYYLDWFLMVAGLVPAWGILADVTSALLNYLRGDLFFAGLDLIAAIPAIGYGGFAAKAIAKTKGKKEAAKYLAAFFKKQLGEGWVSILKRRIQGITKESREISQEIAGRYFKDKEKAADVIDVFHENLNKIDGAVNKFFQLPVFVGLVTGVIPTDMDLSKELGEAGLKGKVIFKKGEGTITQYDGGIYIIKAPGFQKSVTKQEADVFIQALKQEG